MEQFSQLTLRPEQDSLGVDLMISPTLSYESFAFESGPIKLVLELIPEQIVVYFDQLSGAACTRKLVETPFFAVFKLFCFTKGSY